MATIYDVAREAGVSPKTVSRVLNGDAPVNQQTRARVEAAISKLGFVRSHAARTMRSQRSGLIGIITGAISNPHHFDETSAGLPDMQIVQSAQRIFSEQNMIALISDTSERWERVAELVQTLMEHRVEGILYIASHHQKVSFPSKVARDRMVLVNCYDDEGTPAVVPDDAGGQLKLVEGLIARGHTRIGFLTPPKQQVAHALRLDGYKRALAAAGIAYDPQLVEVAALLDFRHEFDHLPAAIDHMLGLKEPPTVICCGNDKMAMRVYALLNGRGLHIPDEISVVGYDNHRIVADYLHPRLSTAVLPYEAMGARAAERLLRIIRGQTEPNAASIELVSGPPVWRDSVLEKAAEN